MVADRARAEALKALDDDGFNAELQAAFGDGSGRAAGEPARGDPAGARVRARLRRAPRRG